MEGSLDFMKTEIYDRKYFLSATDLLERRCNFSHLYNRELYQSKLNIMTPIGSYFDHCNSGVKR